MSGACKQLQPDQYVTQIQIDRCKMMHWNYLGDGLFEKDDVLGYFDHSGKFVKEVCQIEEE